MAYGSADYGITRYGGTTRGGIGGALIRLTLAMPAGALADKVIYSTEPSSLTLALVAGGAAGRVVGVTLDLALVAPDGTVDTSIPAAPIDLALAIPAGTVPVVLTAVPFGFVLAMPGGVAAVVSIPGATGALALAMPAGAIMVPFSLGADTCGLVIALQPGTPAPGYAVNPESMPALLAEGAYLTAQWAEPQWTDLGVLLSIQIKRRRARLRGKFEAGTAEIMLDNRDGSKDLLNPASIFGDQPEGHRVRVRSAIPAHDVNLLTVDQATSGAEGAVPGWVGTTNATVAQTTPGAYGTPTSTTMTAQAAGTVVAGLTGGLSEWWPGHVEVVQGRVYQAMGQANPAVQRSVTLRIAYYTVGHVFISYSSATKVCEPGVWTSVATGLLSPPAAAAYAGVEWTAAGLTAGEAVSFDSVTFGSVTGYAVPAVIEPMFDGYHDRAEAIWPSPTDAQVRLTLVDIFGPLARGRLVSDTYRSLMRAAKPAPFAYARMHGGSGYSSPFSTSGVTWPDEMRPGRFGVSTLNYTNGVGPKPVSGALVTDDNGAQDAIAQAAVLAANPIYGGAGNEDFGYEMWVRVTGTPSDPNLAYTYDSQSGTQTTHKLQLNGAGKLILLTTSSSGGNFTSSPGPLVITDGLWHHVFVVRYSSYAWQVWADGVAQIAVASNSITSMRTALGIQLGLNQMPAQVDEVATWAGAPSVVDYVARYWEGRGKWGRALSSERVKLVTTLAGIPPQLLDIGQGVELVEAVDEQLNNVSPLAHLFDVETAEDGTLFASKAGKLTFRGRSVLPTPVSAIYGDGPTELPYVEPPRGSRDNLDVLDEVAVTPARGSQIIDAAPPSKAMKRSLTITTIGVADNARIAAYAKRIRLERAVPLMRLSQLQLDPAAAPVLQPVVLAHEIGDSITVRRRPANTPLWSVDAVVEGYEHNITPLEWRTAMDLGGRYAPGPEAALALPSARVQGRAQNFFSSTNSPVDLYDNWWDDNGFASSVHWSRLTVAEPGIYYAVGSMGLFGAIAGIGLRLNGSTFLSFNYVPAGYPIGSTSTLWRMKAGDYIELMVVQFSGTLQQGLVGTANAPELSITRMGTAPDYVVPPPASVALPLVLLGDSKTVQYTPFYTAKYPAEYVRQAGGNSQDPGGYPWIADLDAIGAASVIVLQDYPQQGAPYDSGPVQDTPAWRAAWTALVIHAKTLAPRVIVLVDTILVYSTKAFMRSVALDNGAEYLDMVPPDYSDGIHYDYAGAIAMATKVHDRIFSGMG